MLGIMNLAEREKEKKKTHMRCHDLAVNETTISTIPTSQVPLSSSTHLTLPQLPLEIRPIISSDRIILVRQQIISLFRFFLLFPFHSVNLRQQIQSVARLYSIFMF